jgi:hypothetical protein
MPKAIHIDQATGRPLDHLSPAEVQTHAENPPSPIHLFVAHTVAADKVTYVFKDSLGHTVTTSTTTGHDLKAG